jgi:hypothetical protein
MKQTGITQEMLDQHPRRYGKTLVLAMMPKPTLESEMLAAFIHFQKNGDDDDESSILRLAAKFQALDAKPVNRTDQCGPDEVHVPETDAIFTCHYNGLVPIRRLPFGRGYVCM